jgi:hypothetical protein
MPAGKYQETFMRSILAVASLGAVLLVVGCNVLKPHAGGGIGGGGVVKDNAMPKVEDLVRYLNDNAAKIGPDDGLKGLNLEIDCKADRQNVGLVGDMICQKPRNFRLQAKVLGQPTVDIGSNNEEFWYWISKDQPPYLYHCSYEALARGAQVPFPFQPDMVITALGIAQYDPAKKYELNVPPGKNYFELIERTTSSQGQPILKVVAFNRQEARPGEPQIIAYSLRDEKGKDLCIAHIKSVQQNRETGVILPSVVKFEWPAQRLSMTLKMNNLQVTKMDNVTAGRFFSRKNLNLPSFDIATRKPDGPGLQQAGATTPPVGMR